jgi:hypothetical protein
MNSQVVILEEIAIVAPFGLRFWDVAAAAPADEGLAVWAYPEAVPELRTRAVWNAAGVYSFSRLPGLSEAENGAGDDAYWTAHLPRMAYRIEVSDPQDRYLPLLLPVLLPVRGLYSLFASPPFPVPLPDAAWIPIFSTPSRPLPGPSGMLRADLWDQRLQSGAAWAMVTVQAPGLPLVIGLADERGVISLSLPYPELRNSPFGSPLGAPLKLSAQSWPVDISIHYTPEAGVEEFPELERVLQQEPAFAWHDTAHSALATTFTLQFGKDLVLRSLDSASGRELPYLLVTAAGSPL